MLQITDSDYKFDKELLEKTAKSVFSYLREDFEANLKFVDSKGIRSLNKQYRGKDVTTDVLSFKLEEEENGGDIVICYEVAESQANELGAKLDDELAFLLVHGMLHLAGFDHMSTEDQAVMEAYESAILKLAEINLER